MQKSNTNGTPFLRRQSVPAATQFLRLGVGIDHVDVDHSDDEDAIYQGIEHGMEGHHDTDLSEEDEEEEDEDDEDIEQEGDVQRKHRKNVDREQPFVGGGADNLTQTQAHQGPSSNSNNNTRQGDITIRPQHGSKEQTKKTHQRSKSQALLDSDDIIINNNILDNIHNSSHKVKKNGNNNGHPVTTSPGSSSHPQLPNIGAQPGATSTTDKHGKAAPCLPTYHEKFSTKIHGSSPLSAQPLARSPSQKTPNPIHPESTISQTPQVRRFAEKEGYITIHAWKIKYKVCYPTFDPLYPINGNGRNIILFHDALSNLGTWRKTQQTLADRTGCRVLSYDRVGYGFSDKPSSWPKSANPYKNGGVMAVCQNLLDTMGMNQNLILIGNGTGATIASALALSNPLSVRGLILIAPSILDESPPMYLRACVSYPAPLSWLYRRLYGNHGPLQQFYHKPATIMSDPKTVDMYMAPTKEEGFWRGLTNATKFRSSFRIDKHVSKLTELSTLVMTGDVDDVVPTIETLRLFETLQTVRQPNVPQVLKIIKHSGHLPQEEKPTEFIKVTSFFIKKVCLGSLSRERSVGGRSVSSRRMSGGMARSGSKKSANGVEAPGSEGGPSRSPGAGGRRASTRAITDANTQANTHVNNHGGGIARVPQSSQAQNRMHYPPLTTAQMKAH
ncbi:MAG: Alpha/Beta hydrolase protein [Podila humilis]|nr:MAG: Alpha/Beta hydrolase protein [Podila humilis]